jgi:hypothetical protein
MKTEHVNCPKLAREVAARRAQQPDVKRWIRRFKRLARDMPEGIWVFCGGGCPTVLAFDDGARPFMTWDECVDQEAAIVSVSGGHWEGGDW